MDIPAATIDQVRLGRDGRKVTITDDVGNIAAKLKAISPKLGLQWNERGEFFAVVEHDGPRERLVTTALELDDRLVKRIELLASPTHDYGKELERIDLQVDRDHDHRFAERSGEISERLAFHVRKDVEAKNRVFLPKGV